MLKRLDDKEREHLRSIFENEFDSELPREDQAHIFATEDAFITLEYLLRAGLFWVAPEKRDTPEAVRQIRELVTHLKNIVPHGQSVIAIASTPKEERLMRRMKMRPIDGKLYRYDA